VNNGPSARAQLIIASALLVAFGVLVVVMLGWAETWEERVYVFGAVEAIVFTAVGWIFGREVHRQTAERAQEDAAAAKQEAKSSAEEAKGLAVDVQKGLALKAAIEAAAAGGAPEQASGPRDVSAIPPVPNQPPASLAHLKAMAERLYD
jgi:hypothetical protein